MLNRYTVAGLIVAFGLTFASAQTPSNNSQPQDPTASPSQVSPQQSPVQPGPPTQTPGAAPSATPQAGSTTAPSGTETQQPGSSSASGTASSAQSAPAGSGNSVEQQLGLTEDQKTKLRPIIDEEVSQINAVRNDQTMSIDQKRAKVEQIRQTEFPKIQAILTPEQRQKLLDMQHQREQQQGAGQSNPQKPPQ
jgi:periplasmic protein CpxP/Spy